MSRLQHPAILLKEQRKTEMEDGRQEKRSAGWNLERMGVRYEELE